ncbi:MAG TPA: hypothetical protein VMT35_04825 [Ignavibacteriaceae bacterium]|nr:hypothetical protein [Ignavibacteriaceae bacterium]
MKFLHLIIFIFLILVPAFPQIVYEPLHNDVYDYLHRLSLKGIIEFDELFKPLPRKYIYEKLIEAESRTDQLTGLEREELEFFKKEYLIESIYAEGFSGSETSGLFTSDSLKRFRLFHYTGKNLKLNVSPILGYGINWQEKDRNVHSWNGLNMYGYLPAQIGLSLDFRLSNESGGSADRLKAFTPVTGIIGHDNKKSFDYSEVKTSFTFDWNWGSFSAAKEFMEYGYAKSGNLVLSDKAPSFPFLMLQIKPAGWINFIYFHGWLSSNVLDSAQIAEYKRDIYRAKYFAWHALNVKPLKGLDLSIGESIIYSDKIEVAYLMPFMFFFLADDYINNGRNKPGDSNAQFFFSISSKDHLKNTHLYGTLFIDEITLRGISGTLIPDNPEVIFDNDRLQIGYNIGTSVTDLPMENLDMTLEYTKIYPFVYGHHTPAQTYTSSSYLMGHWMGHNADMIHGELNYRFLRGLQMKLWGEYIRKGSPDYSAQYKYPQPEFLFGPKNYYKYFGINLKYELMHELNIETGLRVNSESHEKEEGSSDESKLNIFSFAVYYGL